MDVKYAFDYTDTNTGIQEKRYLCRSGKKKEILAFEQVEFEN